MIGWIKQNLRCLKRARIHAEERRRHNDRDYHCVFWWGDRGGYDLRGERCLVCTPRQEEELTPIQRCELGLSKEVGEYVLHNAGHHACVVVRPGGWNQ